MPRCLVMICYTAQALCSAGAPSVGRVDDTEPAELRLKQSFELVQISLDTVKPRVRDRRVLHDAPHNPWDARAAVAGHAKPPAKCRNKQMQTQGSDYLSVQKRIRGSPEVRPKNPPCQPTTAAIAPQTPQLNNQPQPNPHKKNIPNL